MDLFLFVAVGIERSQSAYVVPRCVPRASYSVSLDLQTRVKKALCI